MLRRLGWFVLDTKPSAERLPDDPQASYWTPLHQAVYWGLDAEVVKSLIKGGAFREQ